MSKQQFIGMWTCRQQFRYSLGGCHRKNVYMSNYRESKPKVIDAKCRRCGRRVQFQPTRQDGRGRYRSISFVWLPASMSIDDAFRYRDEAQWFQRTKFNQEMLPQTFRIPELDFVERKRATEVS